MGAGALKGALESIEDSDDLSALSPTVADACREALREEADGVLDGYDHLDGKWLDLPEGIGRIVSIESPTAEEYLDGIRSPIVTIELPDGGRETNTLDAGDVVEPVGIDLDANPAQAAELIEALEAGIEQLEDDGDERLDFARAVRATAYDQHNRIMSDSVLATSRGESR